MEWITIYFVWISITSSPSQLLKVRIRTKIDTIKTNSDNLKSDSLILVLRLFGFLQYEQ